jgi:hypothetical protein
MRADACPPTFLACQSSSCLPSGRCELAGFLCTLVVLRPVWRCWNEQQPAAGSAPTLPVPLSPVIYGGALTRRCTTPAPHHY